MALRDWKQCCMHVPPNLGVAASAADGKPCRNQLNLHLQSACTAIGTNQGFDYVWIRCCSVVAATRYCRLFETVEEDAEWNAQLTSATATPREVQYLPRVEHTQYHLKVHNRIDQTETAAYVGRRS